MNANEVVCAQCSGQIQIAGGDANGASPGDAPTILGCASVHVELVARHRDYPAREFYFARRVHRAGVRSRYADVCAVVGDDAIPGSAIARNAARSAGTGRATRSAGAGLAGGSSSAGPARSGHPPFCSRSPRAGVGRPVGAPLDRTPDDHQQGNATNGANWVHAVDGCNARTMSTTLTIPWGMRSARDRVCQARSAVDCARAAPLVRVTRRRRCLRRKGGNTSRSPDAWPPPLERRRRADPT
jgi:hypothetical protein